MAIAERSLSSNTASTNGAGSLSVSPTGMQEGDWLIFWVAAAGGTATFSNTAGSCTRVHDDLVGGSTLATSSWKKKCGSGEAGPYTFSWSSTRRAVVVCRAYSGCDPTDAVESAPACTTASSNSLTVTGVDPAATGALHIVLEASRIGGGSTQEFTAPTNYTEKLQFQSDHASNPNAAVAWSERALPNANATGDVSFSTGTTDRLIGGSILLKEATGTDATPTPSAITTTVATPAVTTSAGSTPTPAAAATVVSLPAVTASASGDATATPAAITVTASLPAVTGSAGSTPTPAAVAATGSVPAVTATAGSTPTPAAVAAAAALPAATLSAGSTPTPAATASVVALPAAAPSAGSTPTPAALTATIAAPPATASAGSTPTPGTATATVSVPASSLTAESAATPATLAALTALAAPTLSANAAVTPAVIAALAALQPPSIFEPRDLVLVTGLAAAKWRTGPPAVKWRAGQARPKWTVGPVDVA